MYRLVVLLFTLLMPFQLAWSAAAAYCEHEGRQAGEVVAAAHFGHHAHVHQGGDANGSLGHADCNVCSAATTPLIQQLPAPHAAFTTLVRPRWPEPGPLASALARAPDRPQWLRLV